jgi:cyclopropane fatty-acyl-phospholipid synthase-like methyltransferase
LIWFVAEKYGIEGVGLTVFKEQVTLGMERCSGLPVTILLEDYRDHKGEYDHIASLGMFEHVGYKNYREYMELAHSCLKEDGCFLLHTIGLNYSVVKRETSRGMDISGKFSRSTQACEESGAVNLFSYWIRRLLQNTHTLFL